MYINGTNTIVSAASLGGNGRCGSVLAVIDTGWGPSGTVIEFAAPDELQSKHLYSDTARLAISDIFKRAGLVFCCRPDGGSYASSVLGCARYKGAAGNRITVGIKESGGVFSVTTYVDGAAVDAQEVSDGGRPDDNDYVIFSDVPLFPTSGIPFTGGEDALVTDEAYKACLDALSLVTADVIVSDGLTARRAAAFSEFIKQRRLSGGTLRGVISSEGFVPEDADIMTVAGDGGAVYFIGGLLASLPFYKSAVGERYEGSFDSCVFDSERDALAAGAGRLALARKNGGVYIVGGYNGGVGAEEELTARLRDEIQKRINAVFTDGYAGKVRADGAGAAHLQREISDSLSELYESYGISSVMPSVSVAPHSGGDMHIEVRAPRAARICDVTVSAALL